MTARTALRLIQRGWHVLPLLPASKRPYGNCPPCRGLAAPGCAACNAGACEGWWCHAVHGATTDPDYAQRHWPQEALVAVAAGASGLAVLDVEADGMEWLRDRIADQTLVPTLTLASASGRGVHLYYDGIQSTRQHPINRETGKVCAFDLKSADSYVRWTGRTIRDQKPTGWPESMTDWLKQHTGTSAGSHVPYVASSDGQGWRDAPGCRHTAAYRRTGLQRGIDAIRARPEHGAGAALLTAVRVLHHRHALCDGPCGLDEMTDVLIGEAQAVGVPVGYAHRQAWRVASGRDKGRKSDA